MAKQKTEEYEAKHTSRIELPNGYILIESGVHPTSDGFQKRVSFKLQQPAMTWELTVPESVAKEIRDAIDRHTTQR